MGLVLGEPLKKKKLTEPYLRNTRNAGIMKSNVWGGQHGRDAISCNTFPTAFIVYWATINWSLAPSFNFSFACVSHLPLFLGFLWYLWPLLVLTFLFPWIFVHFKFSFKWFCYFSCWFIRLVNIKTTLCLARHMH